MRELRGRNAVVIGASTGIGRALVLALAREGMNVVAAATSKERLEPVVAEARAAGVEADAVVCDVSRREDVMALADFAFERHEAVHLLCNNAAVTTAGPLIEHGDQDWDWICDAVLRGVTHAVQAFAPRMVQQGEGHIVNTGSQAGLVPDWVLNHGPYLPAKGGVNNLTVALRAELAESGVGVSLLIPGMVNTEIIHGSSHKRPAHYGGPKPDPDPPILPRPGAPPPLAGTRFALEPEEAAEIAIDGIRSDLPFIVTHGGMKPVVEDYFGRILAAYDLALAREGHGGPDAPAKD